MQSVTLVASRTIDHINNLDNAIALVRSGGPALYCKQALEALECQVHLVTATRPAIVRITIQKGHESIRIDRIGNIGLPVRLPVRDVVLSPILGEVELRRLAERSCRIFLDAQGYIRARGEDISQPWICPPWLVKKVAVLKVNKRESSFVPGEILTIFQSRILLITHGQEGVEIWDHGKRHMVHGHPIDASDTLGAGDTFFGSFVAAYLQSGDALSAGQLAVKKAEQLLRGK